MADVSIGTEGQMTGVLFVSLTVNLCITLRLFVTGFAQSIKLFRKSERSNRKFANTTAGRTLSNKENDVVNIVVNETVNLLLSGLALACVCVHPVEHYTPGTVPILLQLLVAGNCGRYFYKIGILISLKRSEDWRPASKPCEPNWQSAYMPHGAKVYPAAMSNSPDWNPDCKSRGAIWLPASKLGSAECNPTTKPRDVDWQPDADNGSVWYYCGKLLHYVPALLFYIYVITASDLWWLAVIGTFVEMESLVTSIHGLLRRVYPAYASINTWCLYIQVTSCLCVRMLLPLILLSLFSIGANHMHSTIVMYIVNIYFALYNIFLLQIKLQQLCKQNKRSADSNEVQIIKKQTVPYVEINDIFEKGDCEKSKFSLNSMIGPSDPAVISEKQMTWSMVPLEEISSSPAQQQLHSNAHSCHSNAYVTAPTDSHTNQSTTPSSGRPGSRPRYTPQLPAISEQIAITASCPEYSAMLKTQKPMPVLNNQLDTKRKSVRFHTDLEASKNCYLKSTANVNIDKTQRGKTDAFYDSKFLLFKTKA